MNAPPRARPAATVLLIRNAGAAGAVEVLMTVRNESMAFGSGALVFPGGRVEDSDHAIAEGLLAGAQAGPQAGAEPGALAGVAQRVAAVREAFEECGLLLARDAASGAPIAPSRAGAIVAGRRELLCAGGLGFADLLRQEDLAPAIDGLVYFAHWVTPPERAKRFDTHFFVVEAPPGQEVLHDGNEVTHSVWIDPREAVEEAARGRYKLLFATRLNLMRLAASASTAAAIAAARTSEVVTVMPERFVTADGPMVRIPEAAGYGGSLFAAIDPPAM